MSSSHHIHAIVMSLHHEAKAGAIVAGDPPSDRFRRLAIPKVVHQVTSNLLAATATVAASHTRIAELELALAAAVGVNAKLQTQLGREVNARQEVNTRHEQLQRSYRVILAEVIRLREEHHRTNAYAAA